LRVAWLIATLFAFLVVIACTLLPFHFYASLHPVRSVWDILLIPIGPDKGPDILENVLLFLPVGFTMTGYFTQKNISAVAAIAAVLFLSLCVSYAIEVLQLFMPGRFTSLTDVASNTAGAGLGVLCYSLCTSRPRSWSL
jgi:glycopeptide antibiotics resistance protein